MGGEVPKQLLLLLGKPILVHTIERFLALGDDVTVCLSLHPQLLAQWPSLQKQYFASLPLHRIVTCAGGATRTLSVLAGLNLLGTIGGDKPALVAIHDAVRPVISSSLLEAAYQMAADKGNSVVCVPVKSSMRRITPEGSVAVDRNLYYHVQTPQVFMLDSLLTCFASRKHDDYTDDASLAEESGVNIHICEGSYDNIKITTPEDIAVAEQLLRGK